MIGALCFAYALSDLKGASWLFHPHDFSRGAIAYAVTIPNAVTCRERLRLAKFGSELHRDKDMREFGRRGKTRNPYLSPTQRAAVMHRRECCVGKHQGRVFQVYGNCFQKTRVHLSHSLYWAGILPYQGIAGQDSNIFATNIRSKGSL